jgi:hypothetical protein
MPDLDQIKQGEQGRGTGAGGSPRAGRVIPPDGRAVRLLLAGEGEALARNAIELALAGDPAAAEAQDRARGHAFMPKIHCVPSVEVVCSGMVRFAQSTIWWWPV